MNMTAQRISPGLTIQPNIDPWLSASPSAFAVYWELALSYCNRLWNRQKIGTACAATRWYRPPRAIVRALLRRATKDKKSRAFLLLHTLIDNSN